MGYTGLVWEIELKARVPQPEEVAKKLQQLGQPGGEFDRRDIYYSSTRDGPTLFRLRQEGERAVVTHKIKTVEAGIEHSQETEFSVSDPEAFHRFALSLGYVVTVEKRKRGRWWRLAEDFKAELSEVPPLGFWLELEILLSPEAPAQRRQEAQGRLEETLQLLGLYRASVEGRPYTDLLRQAHLAAERQSG